MNPFWGHQPKPLELLDSSTQAEQLERVWRECIEGSPQPEFIWIPTRYYRQFLIQQGFPWAKPSGGKMFHRLNRKRLAYLARK